MLKNSLIISLVLHLVLFLSLSNKKKEEEKPKKEEQRTQVDLGPKKTEFFELQDKPERCKKVYIGLGITIDIFTSVINEIKPNGPADKAGIQKGDIFVDMCEDKIEGKECEVKILKGKNRSPMVYKIKLTKICAE